MDAKDGRCRIWVQLCCYNRTSRCKSQQYKGGSQQPKVRHYLCQHIKAAVSFHNLMVGAYKLYLKVHGLMKKESMPAFFLIWALLVIH